MKKEMHENALQENKKMRQEMGKKMKMRMRARRARRKRREDNEDSEEH